MAGSSYSRVDEPAVVVVATYGASRPMPGFGTLLVAWRTLEVNLDVMSRPGNEPDEPREREAAEIAVSDARQLGVVGADALCPDLACVAVEDRAQLAGELLLELTLEIGGSHS